MDCERKKQEREAAGKPRAHASVLIECGVGLNQSLPLGSMVEFLQERERKKATKDKDR
jgi:hypothetical protein